MLVRLNCLCGPSGAGLLSKLQVNYDPPGGDAVSDDLDLFGSEESLWGSRKGPPPWRLGTRAEDWDRAESTQDPVSNVLYINLHVSDPLLCCYVCVCHVLFARYFRRPRPRPVS